MPSLEEIQRKALEIVCEGADMAPLAELLSPDHVLHQSVVEGLSPGLAATIGLAKLYRRALPRMELAIDLQLSEPGRAVTRFRVSARHEEKLGAIAPTRARIEATGMLESRFDEAGRAVESWLEISAYSVLRALDVIDLKNPVRLVES